MGNSTCFGTPFCCIHGSGSQKMFQGNSRVAHQPPSLRCTDVPEFTALQRSAMEFKSDPKLHLKHLLADAFRCQGLIAVHNTSAAFEDGPDKKSSTEPQRGAITKDVPLFLRRADSGSNISEAIPRWNTIKQRRIILDYSRQHVTGETMELLFDLADKMRLTESMNELRCGLHVNLTENKSVMHHVLRLPRDYDFKSRHPGGDVILNDVHNVLDKIRDFSEEVRGGKIVGSTGKQFKNILWCVLYGVKGFPKSRSAHLIRTSLLQIKRTSLHETSLVSASAEISVGRRLFTRL